MNGHDVYWLKQASGFGMTLFFVLSGIVIHCLPPDRQI
jgi:hypothetical protein